MTFFRKCKDTIDDYIAKGYAHRVPDEQLDVIDKPLWYLPDHAVFHPRKPDKLRIVFDCAAKFRGTSLNDQLMHGLDLTNNLFGVLNRFRQEVISLVPLPPQLKIKQQIDTAWIRLTLCDSTERINTIYKVTSEYGNTQTKRNEHLQNCGKKCCKYHRAWCTTIRKKDLTSFSGTRKKTTNNCTWTGNLYYFTNKF